MDVFDLRNRLISDFSSYVESFITIRDPRIDAKVKDAFSGGLLWPDPLVQLNPSFEQGEWVRELVADGTLNDECERIFRIGKAENGSGNDLRLHRHQVEAIRAARSGKNYVLTTGTGSGKSLTYIIPIVDHVLRNPKSKGIKAIIVYPMNALANSQAGELEKFLKFGYSEGKTPVTFARYTGQESDEEKNLIVEDPPDILLTNYVMLELILTRSRERRLVEAAHGLNFLVLDELHTYRGRQGADVSLLVRRLRERLGADQLQCVGTSATLAGGGTFVEQRQQVAAMASMIFGDEVLPESIIGETLRRATVETDISQPNTIAELKKRIETPGRTPQTPEELAGDPLASWLESTVGVTAEPESGRLIRQQPLSVSGGPESMANRLFRLTGVSESQCAKAIQETLLGGFNIKHPETGFPLFAFRLHQFISRGDTIYASTEPSEDRYLTLKAQQFVPGRRDAVLLPLAFCRECGQEHYIVRRRIDPYGDARYFAPRDLGDRAAEEDAAAGFLVSADTVDWSEEEEQIVGLVPDQWLEEFHGQPRVKKHYRKYLPEKTIVDALGRESAAGHEMWFFPAPMSLCLSCGVAYASRRQSDFVHLGTLSSEGRSTATTILALSTIMSLRAEQTLPERARKLLSFTDNRQDASLQAGHFNDFIEVALLRAALFKAVQEAGPAGLREEDLTQAVFNAVDLPFELYAEDPDVRYQALYDTQRALRDVIGYRLYRDLKRGWRIIAPNLEQCGLLQIEYPPLKEMSADEDLWSDCHPALSGATPETRWSVAHSLLDYMRRELAIFVDYLDRERQERLKRASQQRLNYRWSIEDEELMEYSRVLFPRSSRGDDNRAHAFLSPRGNFGAYLRRQSTFPDHEGKTTLEDAQQISVDLLECLRKAGLVQIRENAPSPDEVAGYQLPAAAIIWKAGDGTSPHHDLVRVPRAPEGQRHTNKFFVHLYENIALNTKDFEGREHTAQVPPEDREDREKRFRSGTLPVLFCSPTMELGVDIAELNVVNMRNVPPTPANYAQRSGRAGRSGQPALVFTYCTQGSPHDQYYFRRPVRMVAGAVTPPRLDLSNEDLIRSHLQAIWLAESGLDLRTTLAELLELDGDPPTLNLLDSVNDALASKSARSRARRRAEDVLGDVLDELRSAPWYSEGWLDQVFQNVPRRFDMACERWRSLYRNAWEQVERQNRISRDASRTASDREQARRLRREAESQMELLLQSKSVHQSDFYSYRYFASEGFLPGYSFPRLPLSAFIPGRRARRGHDDFISRPRFLAISEFGPRNFIYYEGARYIINKVLLPVGDEGLAISYAKVCDSCGYIHQIQELGTGPDLCERCSNALETAIGPLLRMENVSTRRRERITSDEEERLRLGYEVLTSVRFAKVDGEEIFQLARVNDSDGPILSLTYGHAASLWRINLGWRRRANSDQHGFVLDLERGYWQKNQAVEQDESGDPMSPQTKRVVPYVRDTKNCLLVELAPDLLEQTAVQIAESHDGLDSAELRSIVLLTFGQALKQGIQIEFQLEDNELAAEALPNDVEPSVLMLYESAEGGAGVLRQFVDDPNVLHRIARAALEVCHFDPVNGDDRRRAEGSDEDCEAACYDCLLSYGNQRYHRSLDRQAVRNILMRLRSADVAASSAPLPRAEQAERLSRAADSDLERNFIDFLFKNGLRLPSSAQARVDECNTRPDFAYDDHMVQIYVDGPHHQYPERAKRDAEQQICLEDLGHTVIRFGHTDDWAEIVRRFPGVFGELRSAPGAGRGGGIDLDLFSPKWRAIVERIAEHEGTVVAAGGDVNAGGAVVGSTVIVVEKGEIITQVIDADSPQSEESMKAVTSSGVQAVAVSADDVDAATKLVIDSLTNGGES